MKILSVLTLVVIVIASVVSAQVPNREIKTHKLLFGETPDVPKPWALGFTTTNLFHNELYFYVKDWFSLELSGMFFPKISPEMEKNSFTNFVIKSRSLNFSIKEDIKYSVATGLKISNSSFIMTDSATGDTSINVQDGSAALFLTQGIRHNKHYFNLFTSTSSKSVGKGDLQRDISTFYIKPGYRYQLNHRWNANFEYLLTNSIYFPIIATFENYDRDWISYMFYGFTYSRSKFYAKLVFASHYTFSTPLLPICPLISIGVRI